MIPRCTGSMPYPRAMGVISGTTTMIAEKMSIIIPTMIRKRFSTTRNIVPTADERPGDLEQPLRDFLVHEIVGEPHGSADDHQDGADQEHALLHHPGDIREELEVPVNKHLDDKHVEGGDRRGFRGREDAPIDAPDDHHRKRNFPCGGAQGRPDSGSSEMDGAGPSASSRA